ncbi:MAG: hypothetical protein HY810_06820, partial [Candidatus Omnitrophica bacterium]|nr:hypothetical protein [Candidatus Omnitrophota bacterium]
MCKKIIFRVIAIILINSFLLFDITWADGENLFTSIERVNLSPALNINTELVNSIFYFIYLTQNSNLFTRSVKEKPSLSKVKPSSSNVKLSSFNARSSFLDELKESNFWEKVESLLERKKKELLFWTPIAAIVSGIFGFLTLF